MTERQEIVKWKMNAEYILPFSTLNYGYHSSYIRVFGPFKIYYLKHFLNTKSNFIDGNVNNNKHINKCTCALCQWETGRSIKYWTPGTFDRILINKPCFVLQCELYTKKAKRKQFFSLILPLLQHISCHKMINYCTEKEETKTNPHFRQWMCMFFGEMNGRNGNNKVRSAPANGS